MANKSERAKQLYLQAKKGWKPNTLDFFGNERVALELLLDDMLSIAGVDGEYKHRDEFRQAFYSRVRERLNTGADFDEQYLSKDIVKTINKRTSKTYVVDFGVPVKKSSRTPLPFGKTLTIEGVTFKQISIEQFEKPHKGEDCLTSYYTKFDDNIRKRQDRGYLARQLLYFRAKVSAGDYSDALRLVDGAFRAIYATATMVENSHTLKHSMFGANVKSRSVLFPMGIMLISKDGHKDCNIAWDADVRATVDQSIEFTNKPKKLAKFRVLRKVWTENTPISRRIRKVLVEYANAFHSTDPHLRQLGLWRCLELATSEGGSSRPEEEIIKIVSTYYRKDEAWRQRGKIIKKVRNNYVHNGTYLEQDEYGSVDRYLNWTQEYVDAVLGMLIVMRKTGIGNTSESEIDAFFDEYPKSNEALKVAKIILQHRS